MTPIEAATSSTTYPRRSGALPRREGLSWTSVRGSRVTIPMQAVAPSTAITTNGTRQPACSPSHVPNGMPRIGASAVPIASRATTRPRSSGGKRLVAIGGAIDQNSACEIAITSRPPNSTSYVGAAAESAVATVRTASVPPSTKRRGRLVVSRASGMEASTTTAAYPVTRRPIWERDRPRSSAITVSSPIGSTSMVTKENVETPRNTSAAVARRDERVMRSPDPGKRFDAGSISSMTDSSHAEFRIVGGHPALDLVNTVTPRLRGGAVEHDYLTSPAELLDWSRRIGLIDLRDYSAVEGTWRSAPELAAKALGATLEIREAAYEVLRRGRPAPSSRRTESRGARLPRSSA